MPSVTLAKLSPRLPRLAITTTGNGALRLKKIARREDSSVANSRYTRKQRKKCNRKRKFGAVLRVMLVVIRVFVNTFLAFKSKLGRRIQMVTFFSDDHFKQKSYKAICCRFLCTIKVRNILELSEFSKVQKFQSLARMLTSNLSVNSDGLSCTMSSD